MTHALTMKTLEGATAQVPGDDVAALAQGLAGTVLTPDAPEYDDVRAIWNAMIDRRPGLIVRCRGTADVERAVAFAGTHDLLVSVRGAGHNIAGNAVSRRRTDDRPLRDEGDHGRSRARARSGSSRA